MSDLEKIAKKIQEERNKKWKNAWNDWLYETFVDMIIAKIKRAYNAKTIEDVDDSLIDAYNYSKELKRRLNE